jgi:hypothetical protein
MSSNILDQLLPNSSDWPNYSPAPIQKIRYTHDAMIDQIIANPTISQDQLAIVFGYTASWVSIIINSDTFQARLAERRKELVDPAVLTAVETQFKGLVSRSLAVLMEKLDKPAEAIPDQLALRAFEISSRAAGYGAKPDVTIVNRNEVTLSLEAHGDQLVNLLRRKKAEVLGHQTISQESKNEPSKDLAP